MNIMAASPFDRLWRGEDPLRWIEEAGGEPFRELPDRRTTRLEVEGQVFFAKVHRGVGLGETLRSLASLRLPVFDAGAEVKAIARLREAGVDVPEVAAWGADDAPAHRRRSFIVTRDVGTQRTLADVAAELPRTPIASAAPDASLGRAIGAMHAAGVNHRDCYLARPLPRARARRRAAAGAPRPAPRADPRGRRSAGERRTADSPSRRWTRSSRAPISSASSAYAGGSAAAALRAAPSLWRAVESRRSGLVAERARRGERFGR